MFQQLMKNKKKLEKEVGKTTIGKAGQQTVENVKDKVEDAREFWETSQNPIVYAVAGAYENLTGETEEAIAIKDFRKLDPDFDIIPWSTATETTIAPALIKAHLRGDISKYKDQLSEAVYHKLSADIDARKKDGLVIDPNVLAFEQVEVTVRHLEGTGPVIVCMYRVQQIHCVRNTEGEVVDGDESDVRAKFYHMIFQQHYVTEDEGEEGEGAGETGYVVWKVGEYGFFGDVPYY